MIIPNIWKHKNVPNHQPDTHVYRFLFGTFNPIAKPSFSRSMVTMVTMVLMIGKLRIIAVWVTWVQKWVTDGYPMVIGYHQLGKRKNRRSGDLLLHELLQKSRWWGQAIPDVAYLRVHMNGSNATPQPTPDGKHLWCKKCAILGP